MAEVAQNNGAHDAGNSQINVAATLETQSNEVRGAAGAASGFPELTTPHLVVASPAGIALTSGRDTHIASENHTAITSGKDVSVTAGTSLFASIRQTFRLFVQKAGMKLIAASGDIDILALSNSIKLLAKLEISQQANRITISAKEEVVINGGGSYAKFSAGSIEIGTSGSFVAHASTHSLPSGKSMNVAIPVAAAKFGSSLAAEEIINDLTDNLTWVEFKLIDETGAIANESYVLTDPCGSRHTGKVNEQGIARIDAIPAGHCKIEIPNLGYTFEVSSS